MRCIESLRLPSSEGNDARALMILGNRIGLFGSLKSYPNENYTNGAKNHAKHSGGTHNESPIGGLALRHKIALIAFVLAIFVALFSNAIRLGWLGREAALPYLLLSVGGIFATVLIGFPLVVGVAG